MTIALVSAGSAATGSTSASPAFGQATGSSHLLLAWATSNNSGSSYPISLSGAFDWQLLTSTGVAYNWLGLYYKQLSTSSDSAPVFSDASATYVAASLAEFSGTSTVTEVNVWDAYGVQPESGDVTASATDSAASELIVAVFTWNGSAGSPTISLQLKGSDANNATTSVMSTGEGASPPFWTFGYALGPSTLGTHANEATCTISEYENAPAGIVASFKHS